MRTTKLYRPVGMIEMELIAWSKYKAFPPRLEGQPIFYPVMNTEYAEHIAREWNTDDVNSGFCGIVTEFDVDTNYLSKYEIQNVGAEIHNELWIPSEQLNEFNSHIVGEIRITKVFMGKGFEPSQNHELNQKIESIIHGDH